MLQKLPIDACIPEIKAKLKENSSLILKSPPGTGKTTRVPPALASSHSHIWVIVPRRLAAKSAAQRIAEEQHWKVGEEVGYHFRYERRSSPQTKILFITEGMFFKLIQNPESFEKVSLIILDEFHERHLHADLILNYVNALQEQARSDLKLLVMSATLEGDKLEKFLARSSSLEIQEKTHELEIFYLPHENLRLEQKVLQALQKAFLQQGDILVFLPGQAEIRRCQTEISSLRTSESFVVQTLFGDLAWEEQQKIFEASPKRKIILSTNIAESSLTIPGVRIVIDSGLHREASFSPWNGLPQLITRPISQASAIQRAGRAAREGKGYCYRLYGEHDFRTRANHEKPEIQRADLAQSFLELFLLKDLKHWKWFEEPPAAHLKHAMDLLFDLGAIQSKSFPAFLTSMGKEMARLAIHPRLSRALLESDEAEVRLSLALLCAYLSESNSDTSDARDCLQNQRHPPLVLKSYEQILRSLNIETSIKLTAPISAIGHSLLKGFPDAIGKKRGFDPREETELVMCQGPSIYSKPHAFLKDADYFIVLDAQHLQLKGSTKNFLRLAFPITEEILLDEAHWLREAKQLVWNTSRKSVVEKEGLYYGKIILEENEKTPSPSPEACALFLKEALGIDEKFWQGKVDVHDFIRKWEGIENSEVLEENLARLLLLKPELSLEEISTQALQGVYRVKQLEESHFSQRIFQSLSGEDQSKINSLLPTQLSLNKGRKAKIHYRLNQSPWVASRLQDFLGMKNIPRLLNGKLALTLHLLAPNQRPVQVTQDLESFWKNTYPQLRPQLSRRYPRHVWPENPLQA